MNLGFKQFIEDIKQYNIEPKVIYEIGSRDCLDALDFQRYFPMAKVVAFEPSAENFKICQENAKGTNVEVYNFALSDYTGKATFHYTPANIGASSLLKPNFIPWAQDQTVITEEVEVKTLDNFCKWRKLYPDICWIDVQGAELFVLKGAIETLKNVKAIYSEMGVKPYYQNHTLKPEIIDFLNGFGFEVIREQVDWEHEENVTLINTNLI